MAVTNALSNKFDELDEKIKFQREKEVQREKERLQRVQLFRDIFKTKYWNLGTDVDSLINQLEELGYFYAPASTKYHGTYIGGLFDHSWRVTKELVNLTTSLDLDWQRLESPYIVGMFHDLCKCDDYIYDPNGERFGHKDDLILNGHGEKSVIMTQKLLDLTDEEIACIRWHMGAYDDKENWNILGRAIEKYPNVLYTHTADMIATRIRGI